LRGSSSDLAENLPKAQVNISDYREIIFWLILAVLGHFGQFLGVFWPNWTNIIFLGKVLRFG
jgi:hypothetical protein